MVTIKINGMPVQAEEGARLIDVIRGQGITVPSLCYEPGMDHYTSCMVCMVRENNSGKFIPSCSAMVAEGMDIDADGPSVTDMRAGSVRLLLVEHRAECEAPCKLVCPYKLDIPLMNRLLTAGKTAEATRLAFQTLTDPVAVCTACKGYCDKACRRKKIDINISIKNTVIFLCSEYTPNQKSDIVNRTAGELAGGMAEGNQKSDIVFNSTLGPVTDTEFSEWAREAVAGARNHPNPSTIEEACEEASRCLHCDCRAAGNCGLRDAATALGVKNPRNKRTAHPITKKINPVSGLIFEHAKCIKCGLCVRLGEQLTGAPSLCFRGRGYETIITEPLYHHFADILNDSAPRFAAICPTGALALKEEIK